MKDEQNIFLRLSDAMAGFLREVYEGGADAKSFMQKLEKKKIIVEV